MLVGMMPYEKLAQRDIDQLRLPIRDCTTALTPEDQRVLISSVY